MACPSAYPLRLTLLTALILAGLRSRYLMLSKKSMVKYHDYSDQFQTRDHHHAGMIKKPLEPYNPDAFRNRLPSPTIVMPHKNSSQIVIGDRS